MKKGEIDPVKAGGEPIKTQCVQENPSPPPPPRPKCKNQRFQVVLKLGGRKILNSIEAAIWALNPLPHPTLPSNQPLPNPAGNAGLFSREDEPEKHYTKGNTLGSGERLELKSRSKSLHVKTLRSTSYHHHPSSSHFLNNPQNTYLQMMGRIPAQKTCIQSVGDTCQRSQTNA